MEPFQDWRHTTIDPPVFVFCSFRARGMQRMLADYSGLVLRGPLDPSGSFEPKGQSMKTLGVRGMLKFFKIRFN
jgi:hypothetical protein